MKDHAGGCQHAGEDTHGKRDGVNESVDEGVEPNAQHGDEPDIIMCVRRLIAHKRVDEPVKQMQAQIPGEQVDVGIRIH